MFRRVKNQFRPNQSVLYLNAGVRVPARAVLLPGNRFASSNNGSKADSVANATSAQDKDTKVTGSLAEVKSSKGKAAKSKKEKPPLWDRVKHEFTHYVNGTKLLGYEIKISSKLLVKFVQGYELSRREKNQLKRTMSDVFRLVPFSAFLIIPFAELLLPVALKVFPNLLPSTYESGKEKKLKRTKLNDIRAKTSNFLQETLEESSLINYKSLESAEKKKQFLNFFKRLNSTKDGKENVFTHDEILKVAKMFKNDTVLDNLSRPQLIAMAKYMSLRPFGNDNMLRYQIRFTLKNIMDDDKVIDYEDVQSLTDEELYQACVSRGIKTFGVSKEELVENLKVWLELRLRHHVPSVLLVLSSAYTFGGISKEQKVDAHSVASMEKKVADTKFNQLLDFYYDGILQVLSSIPDPVYNVAKLDVSESKDAPKPAAAKTQPKEDPSVSQLASEVLATSVSGAAATATASATANAMKKTTNMPPDQEQPSPTESVSAKADTATPVKEKPNAVDAESSAKKESEEAVEEEEEEDESHVETDENAFKLSVLKEQEELIRKEEEEAKLRSQREIINDDISLDESEDNSESATELLPKEPERKQLQKAENFHSEGKED